MRRGLNEFVSRAHAGLLTPDAVWAGLKAIGLGLPARGYRVRSLGHIQPSLEDVFLAATRRSWDARLPDKANGQGESRAPLPKV